MILKEAISATITVIFCLSYAWLIVRTIINTRKIRNIKEDTKDLIIKVGILSDITYSSLKKESKNENKTTRRNK